MFTAYRSYWNRLLATPGFRGRKRGNKQKTSPERIKVAMNRAHMAIDKTKRQLLAHPEYRKLVALAENDEIELLKTMNVYIVRCRRKIPKDAFIIGSRLVHTVDESDKKSNGKVKATCVAQGYKQPIGPEEKHYPVISP